jgi:hypothetical protein
MSDESTETGAKHPKFAPADAAGRKPYVVTKWTMGRVTSSVIYAPNAAAAKGAFRMGTGQYVKNVRRALWDEAAAQ